LCDRSVSIPAVRLLIDRSVSIPPVR